MSKTHDGFGIIELLVIVLVVGLLGTMAYLYMGQQKSLTKNTTTATASVASQKNTGTPAQPTDPNAGYLVVKEWGLRFKVPSGLTNVQYKIFPKTAQSDDTLAFYAMPAGHTLSYASDFESNTTGVTPDHALGVVYRSSDATKQAYGNVVSGKKLGNYYYYSAWSFSGLASGASCVSLYALPVAQDCPLEQIAFPLVNQGPTALLNTIELAQ